MWDSVPWFVGGGAYHSPEVARLLAFAATSGTEGIVTPGDLKVVPLAVPGSSIRVLAGAGLILNRAAGGAQQTYVGRNPSEDVKAIASTGSGSGRNDLVIAQIKDPFLAGEPYENPADVTVGPYIFTEVLSNVPGSAITDPWAASAYIAGLGLSAMPLAAVVLPPSTGTIGTGQIKDLRRLAQPRSERFLTSQAGGPETYFTSTSGFQNFPNVTAQVFVPSWATHADLRIDISGIFQAGPLADIDMRAHVGESLISPIMKLDNDAHTDGIRHAAILVAGGPILPAERGKLVTLKIMSRRVLVESHPGQYMVDNSTHIGFDLQFTERVV